MCHQCGEFPFALGQSKICVDLISIACSFTEMNTEIVDTYIVAPSLRRTPRVAAVTSILASIWGIANRGHGHFFVTRRMMSGRQYERCIVRCTKKHLTLRSVSDFFFPSFVSEWSGIFSEFAEILIRSTGCQNRKALWCRSIFMFILARVFIFHYLRKVISASPSQRFDQRSWQERPIERKHCSDVAIFHGR